MKHFLFFTRILYFVCYDKIDNISESKFNRTNTKDLLAF